MHDLSRAHLKQVIARLPSARSAFIVIDLADDMPIVSKLGQPLSLIAESRRGLIQFRKPLPLIEPDCLDAVLQRALILARTPLFLRAIFDEPNCDGHIGTLLVGKSYSLTFANGR